MSKTYTVRWTISEDFEEEVEADNEHEAWEQAKVQADYHNPVDFTYVLHSVEEVK
tara:strand:- start:137 stop:301 length:165 start_codon:yes stop_codon:yes gene_type:complete